jgi:DUF2946 family protein
MFRLRHKPGFSLAAWVAITAVVLNALWPLVAQLQPAQAGSDMVAMEDCPEAGMHQGAAGERSAPEQPSPLMPHCGFCTLAAGGFTALVTSTVTTFIAIHTQEFRPPLPEVRLLASFGYSAAHPRAPPVLS